MFGLFFFKKLQAALAINSWSDFILKSFFLDGNTIPTGFGKSLETSGITNSAA
jgi:hypothetical protein